MKLTRIDIDTLSAKQRETYNFHKTAGLLADYGFDCIRVSDDWQGADFLAYHKDEHYILKVQLKSRMTIDRKYVGKDLHMCFRIGEVWYLVHHDDLMRMVEKVLPRVFETESWSRGTYSWPRPSKRTVEALSDYALNVRRIDK